MDPVQYSQGATRVYARGRCYGPLMPASESLRSDGFKVPPGVLSEIVDGEAVLLHLDTGKYFGLNPTGTRIWRMLTESASSARIVSEVASEFGVDEETVWRDLAALVKELTLRGLLVCDEPK
ncbi:MAG: PqqD family protein [Myxococcales bacterium]|nr:PqqD family protein [Myxococcales bacterium]